MTPRTSVRAAARERYLEMKEEKGAAKEAPPAAGPPSLRFGGQAAPSHEGGENGAAPDLTARVRALYEGSSVPVREIARLAGVTERTIYKYAQKHRWPPRYRWRPDGARPVAANNAARGRETADRQGERARGFAPVKGAGGRFIGRADRHAPFATGLKALDPPGRTRALSACDAAAPLARQAQAEVEREALKEACLEALAALNRAGDALLRYRTERQRARAYQAALAIARHNPSYKMPKKPAPRFAESTLRERALELAERVAMARVEALLARQEQAMRGAEAAPRGSGAPQT